MPVLSTPADAYGCDKLAFAQFACIKNSTISGSVASVHLPFEFWTFKASTVITAVYKRTDKLSVKAEILY